MKGGRPGAAPGLELRRELVEWLLAAQIIRHEHCVALGDGSIVALDAAASAHFESGIGVYSMLVAANARLGMQTQPLDTLKDVDTPVAKLYNWNALAPVLRAAGVQLDNDLKALIVAGDNDMLVDVMEQLFHLIMREHDAPLTSDPYGYAHAPANGVYVGDAAPPPPAPPVAVAGGVGVPETPGGARANAPMELLRLMAYPLTHRTLYDFLVDALCGTLGVDPGQASGMLSVHGAALAGVLVNGAKGDFEPPLALLAHLAGKAVEVEALLVREPQGAVRLLHAALQPALVSYHPDVVHQAARFLTHVALALGPVDALPYVWDWFISAGGGLEACLASFFRRGAPRGELAAYMAAASGRGHLRVLVETHLPAALPDPVRYVAALRALLPAVAEAAEARDEFVRGGVLEYAIEYGVRMGGGAQAPAATPPLYMPGGTSEEVRHATYSLLADLWSRFAGAVAALPDAPRAVLATLKKGCRDRSAPLQVEAHAALFRLLDALTAAKDAMAPQVYKTLIFSLIEHRPSELLRPFLLANLAITLRGAPNIPVGVLVEPLLRQAALYGYSNGDFDFHLALATHAGLGPKHAAMLLDFLARVAATDTTFGRLAALPLLLIARRLAPHRPGLEQLLRLAAHLLGLIEARDARPPPDALPLPFRPAPAEPSGAAGAGGRPEGIVENHELEGSEEAAAVRRALAAELLAKLANLHAVRAPAPPRTAPSGSDGAMWDAQPGLNERAFPLVLAAARRAALASVSGRCPSALAALAEWSAGMAEEAIYSDRPASVPEAWPEFPGEALPAAPAGAPGAPAADEPGSESAGRKKKEGGGSPGKKPPAGAGGGSPGKKRGVKPAAEAALFVERAKKGYATKPKKGAPAAPAAAPAPAGEDRAGTSHSVRTEPLPDDERPRAGEAPPPARSFLAAPGGEAGGPSEDDLVQTGSPPRRRGPGAASDESPGGEAEAEAGAPPAGKGRQRAQEFIDKVREAREAKEAARRREAEEKAAKVERVKRHLEGRRLAGRPGPGPRPGDPDGPDAGWAEPPPPAQAAPPAPPARQPSKRAPAGAPRAASMAPRAALRRGRGTDGEEEALNERLRADPEALLPPGWEKVLVEAVREEHVVPADLGVHPALAAGLEMVDLALARAVGAHILDPVPVVRKRAYARRAPRPDASDDADAESDAGARTTRSARRAGAPRSARRAREKGGAESDGAVPYGRQRPKSEGRWRQAAEAAARRGRPAAAHSDAEAVPPAPAPAGAAGKELRRKSPTRAEPQRPYDRPWAKAGHQRALVLFMHHLLSDVIADVVAGKAQRRLAARAARARRQNFGDEVSRENVLGLKHPKEHQRSPSESPSPLRGRVGSVLEEGTATRGLSTKDRLRQYQEEKRRAERTAREEERTRRAAMDAVKAEEKAKEQRRRERDRKKLDEYKGRKPDDPPGAGTAAAAPAGAPKAPAGPKPAAGPGGARRPAGPGKGKGKGKGAPRARRSRAPRRPPQEADPLLTSADDILLKARSALAGMQDFIAQQDAAEAAVAAAAAPAPTRTPPRPRRPGPRPDAPQAPPAPAEDPAPPEDPAEAGPEAAAAAVGEAPPAAEEPAPEPAAPAEGEGDPPRDAPPPPPPAADEPPPAAEEPPAASAAAEGDTPAGEGEGAPEGGGEAPAGGEGGEAAPAEEERHTIAEQ
eukprot:tig00001604_g9405.t1